MPLQHTTELPRGRSPIHKPKHHQQRYDKHQIIQNQVRQRMTPHPPNTHYKGNRRQIDLPRANQLQHRDCEPYDQRTDNYPRCPRLLADRFVDTLLQRLGQLQCNLFYLPLLCFINVVQTQKRQCKRPNRSKQINTLGKDRKFVEKGENLSSPVPKSRYVTNTAAANAPSVLAITAPK